MVHGIMCSQDDTHVCGMELWNCKHMNLLYNYILQNKNGSTSRGMLYREVLEEMAIHYVMIT